jgi:hypothetical protein
MKDPAFRSGFTFEANVFKKSGVPQRIEIALDRGLVIHITWMGKNMRFDHVRGNASIAVHLNFCDQILLREQ